MQNQKKQEKGITLIALVITIIVLLILAGVSIAMLAGDNGILNQASKSTIQNAHATVKEALLVEYNSYLIEIKTSKYDLKEGIEIASTQNISIQAEKRENFANQTTNFWDYLLGKNYIDENGIVNVVNLTGTKLSIGNGTDTKDVYKLEDEQDKYVLKYYGEDSKSEMILALEKNDSDNSKIRELTIEDPNNLVGGAITIQYEEGMTWSEWLKSEYNDGNYRKNGSTVLYGEYGDNYAEVCNGISDSIFIKNEKIDSSNKYYFIYPQPIKKNIKHCNEK